MANRKNTKLKKSPKEHPLFVDEEIDEDMAFNQDDYSKYGDVGKQKNQNEDCEEDEEGDDEAVYRNLSDLVEENDDNANSFEFWKHQGLIRKVSSIGKPKKARVEIEETKPESQFNVEAQEKVTISDLLEGISNQDQYQSLREQFQKIQEKNDGVDLPTPNVTKDRELREAQFEETSKELSQWTPTVTQMRDAPYLSFPLEKPEKPIITSNLLSENFVPETPLEKQIYELIRTTMVSSDKILEDAQVTLSHKKQMDKEAQLAKLRSMLLYQEKKFKWQKKIKSRTYRRILRKQKEKMRLTMEELRELDPKTANDEAEKKEKARVLERVTLRHKTIGKWAKGAAKSKNPLLKQQLQDTHHVGQELRKKIQKINSESEEEEEISSSEEPEVPHKGLLAMKFMQRAQEKQKAEYKKLREDMEKEDQEHELKYQISAKKLRGEDVSEELKKLNKEEEIEVDVPGRQNFSGKTQERKSPKTDWKNAPGGTKNKVVFAGKYETEEVALGTGFTSKVNNPITIKKSSSTPEKSENMEPESENSKSEKEKLFEIPDFPEVQIEQTEEKDIYNVNKDPTDTRQNFSNQKKKNSQKRKFNSVENKKPDSVGHISKKRKSEPTVTSKNNNSSEPVLLKPTLTPRPEKKEPDFSAEDDFPKNEVPIPPRPLVENPWMNTDSDKSIPELDLDSKKKRKTSSPSPKNSNEIKKSKKKKNYDPSKKINLDLDRLESRAIQTVIEKSKPVFNLVASTSKTQKELIQRAFAHDNVENEFEDEKMRKVESDLPEEDLGLELPGWGGWAGSGLVYKPKPKDLQKIENQKKKREELRKKRKDAKLAKVIINEKKNPTISKYQVPFVPFGFPNADAYERNHRNPLGKEWNTYRVHQKIIRPKVVVHVGNVIVPIEQKVDSFE